jgi:hypothetical protein
MVQRAMGEIKARFTTTAVFTTNYSSIFYKQ